KRIRLKRDKSEQNMIKTGQKREAWRSPENSKAVSVDRARKTEENAKRMVKNANTNSVSSNIVVESTIPFGTVLNAFNEENVAMRRRVIRHMLLRADEVSKYNYREFGDVVSFYATFKINKYNMVFVPFTAMDNHMKCVTICAKIYDETDFKEKLNKIVWNMYIGPEEFKYRWGNLMEEFKLMRTISRLESKNLFFFHFTNYGSTLMNFMNCFEMMMEKQRHVQERRDHKTIDTAPKLKTFLKIERHTSNVYTRSLFELVQKEIFDVDKCKDKAEEDDPVDMFFKKDGLYKLFVRVGILCKHVFCVFKNAIVEMITQQYILRNWTKNLIPAALRNKRNRYGEKNVVVENFANEATSIVDYCGHLLSKDEPRLGAFVEKLTSLKKYVKADCPNPPSKNKTDNLEQLVGVPKPPVVEVNNPTFGLTKGRKKLRIKGGKKKAIEKSLKGRNSFSSYGGTDHNKRTCLGRFEVENEVLLQKKWVKRKLWLKKKCVKKKLFKKL
nr:protein FAR1-related sequence 5 [Tanacetum cinerariifolium]